MTGDELVERTPAPSELEPPPASVIDPARTDDVDLVVDAARGFGVTAPVGRYSPVPSVLIGDELIPAGVDRGDPAGLVVLDDVAVRWGVDSPLDQAPPATCELGVLDFSRRWALDRDLIGSPVVLRWDLPGLTGRVYFRGRIAGLELTQTTVQLDDGRVLPATRVAITASSVEMDLGNRRPAEATWPAETIGARTSRISAAVAAASAGAVASVATRAYWSTPQAFADDVSQTSLRDLLVQLYNSTGGDRAIYSPERKRYEHLGRRELAERGFATLTRATAPNPRGGQGVYATPVFRAETGVVPDTGRAYLDAAAVEYPDELPMRKEPGSRITRAVVDSRDAGAGDAQKTTTRIDPTADEGFLGQRAITLQSIHNWNDWAALNADDLLSIATNEGAQWRFESFRLDTGRTGGFEHSQQVELFLRGHAVGFFLFLQRSELAALDVRPVVAVLGGTIRYRRRSWVVDFHVLPIRTRTATHAITWEEIDDGTPANQVEWWDDDHPNGMHETLTLDDLGFVALGNGMATIPPDQGYDK